MAIPSWLTCTAADVQTDSRIAADMAKNSYDDTAFQVEVTRRVTEWSSVVANRLRRAAMMAGLISSFDDDLSDVLNSDQQDQASLALKLLVISALWQNLPGTDSQYSNQANNTGLSGGATESVEKRLTSGEGLLQDLEKQIKVDAQASGANGLDAAGSAVSTRLTRVDAYSQRAVRCYR